MSPFGVALAVCLSLGATSQKPSAPRATARTFARGQLIENVASGSAPGHQFTLYIPNNYDPSRPAPILYLMDPRSRARVPAKLFQPVAERFGYLLISSHNSTSDREVQPNLEALRAMWTDSHDWFSIDDRRVYVAGLSGTARIATLVGVQKPGTITGIIGAGAGFHPDAAPSSATQLLYFATVGDADFNFHEMQRLEDSLASLNLAHRMEHFAGPHSWMPAESATRAVEWMELRAMQSGARAADEALIAEWWARDSSAVQTHIAGGNPLDAARLLAAMARDYAGLRPLDDIAAQAAATAAMPAARTQMQQRQAAIKRTNQWAQDAMVAINESYAAGSDTSRRPASELAVELELVRLKKQASGPDAAAALEARRRLNQLEVQLGFYLPAEALEHADFARAQYYLSIALQVNDGSPVSWYLAAKAHAHLREPRQALTALARAVDAGFRDLASLQVEPAFQRLRSDPRYLAIAETLRASGDTLDLPTIDRPPIPRRKQ